MGSYHRLNPHPLHWKVDSQPLDHHGNPRKVLSFQGKLWTKRFIFVHCMSGLPDSSCVPKVPYCYFMRTYK